MDRGPRGYGPGPRGGSGGYGFAGYGRDAGPPRDMIPRELPPPVQFIDREKTCPLLLRVFVQNGSHRKLEEYATRGKEPPGEIQIYTWMDANLRELSDLIKEVNAQARHRSCRLSFAFVYPDKHGRNVMRQVGIVHSSRPSEDDHRTLKSLRFQTGDFLDVAVLGF